MSYRSIRFRLAATLAVTVACAAPGSAASANDRESTATRGLVFVVGGVGGIDPVGHVTQWALPRAGLNYEVRDFVWTHGFGQVLKDLQDTPYLLKKAKLLADEVLQVKAEESDRPVYLIAKSGGTGLALAAAELLPPETLERIVLLSAAVSPTYDLRPALRATKHEIVSFYSPYDRLILGWGTSQFGTADRVYGPSAGLVGFKISAELSDADRVLYRRLVQQQWSAAMILQGYAGNHLGTSMPLFIQKEVAPWLQP